MASLYEPLPPPSPPSWIILNPYFAIPNQEGQEAPAVKMEIPGGPQKNLDAGVPEAQGNMGGMAHKAQAERIPGGAVLDFGDTVITGGEEDSSTVILSSQMRIENGIPYLRRTKNGQKMYVDKPVMKIGREGSYVDFYIGDNPSVSRSHADIIREDGIYYIRDNNSSNHTFVGTDRAGQFPAFQPPYAVTDHCKKNVPVL